MRERIIDRMERRRDALQAELEQKTNETEEVRSELESFSQVIEYYKQHPDELDFHYASPDEVKNTCVEILSDENDLVLHYKSELYPRLLELGLELSGENPVRTLGAYLSGDDRFISDGAGNWTLRTVADSAIAKAETGTKVVNSNR